MVNTSTRTERFSSLDATRGIVVALVVFFEFLPATTDGPLSWLAHSPWLGLRAPDLVFPAFVFLLGAGMAVTRRRGPGRLVRRAVALVVLGLLYNAWGTSGTDLARLRLTGVLQLLGVSSLLGGLVLLRVRRAGAVGAVAGALLAGHGSLLLLGDLDRGTSTAWTVDRALLPRAHLYAGGAAGHDPEGVLAAVLGGTALVLIGWTIATLLYRVRRSSALLSVVWFLVAAAMSWLLIEPSKRLWTPTFSLLAAAATTALLVTASAVVERDFREPGPVTWVLVALGRNAIVVYVGHHVVLATLYDTESGGRPLAERWIDALGGGTAGALWFASLAVVAWTAIAAAMHAADWHVTVP